MGECKLGDQFLQNNCNRKIIGARYHYEGFEQDHGPLEEKNLPFFRSARDDFGHGSHTASTAVGSILQNVPIAGMGTNTVQGGAPYARIAVYKVCWLNLCSCSDVLKAFDDAIYDNVDIIAMSAGKNVTNNIPDFLNDCFSIGSLYAFENGILVIASAGNQGAPATVSNAAPWTVAVAASSIDREFVTPIQLGNGMTLKSYGLNNKVHLESFTGVIAASFASNPGVPPETASSCKRKEALDLDLIRGKIVVCTMDKWDDGYLEKSVTVKDAGGAGMIIVDPYGSNETRMDFQVPTSVISHDESEELIAYLRTSRDPTASIDQSQMLLYTKPASNVALFSSRGPGSAPNIIKPDITAPGLNILAAWPPPLTQNAGA